MSDLTCNVCGTELSMAQLFANEDTQRAFARLATVSVPLGARVLQYTTLFAPPKTRLTVPKQVKVVLALLPDLERQAITFKGRDWTVPLSVWAQGFDQMVAARDLGRLDLPMKNHAYLYAVLCGMADKQEAAAEAQGEANKRGPRQDTVQVKGQAMPIGQALQQVYAVRDPLQAKLDADAANAAPMPDSVRQQIAALSRRKPTPPTEEKP